MSGNVNRDELDSLAHKMAEESARMDIESFGVKVGDKEYDLTDLDSYENKVLKRACRYLELRGLLRRDTDRPNVVRIEDKP